MDGLRLVVGIFGAAVHRRLCEVAVGERAAFNGSVRRVLFADAVQSFFNFVVLHDDFRMVGAKFFVALDNDLGHDLEAGLELQRFAVMDVQVGDAWLRDRNHPELFSFLAEVSRDECFDDIALEIFFKALADDRGGYMAGAEAWQPSYLLVFLDKSLGLAGHFVGGDFDRDLALHPVLVLCVYCL